MEKQELQKLRDLPIEGVAERLGLTVKMHKCLCPFHDDHHASLSFSVRRNTYRCFVCGASGGTIDLVMNHLHLSFPDACRWLADENNVNLETYQAATIKQEKECRFEASRYVRFFERPFLNDEARKFLFEERRLDPRVIAWCRLISWTDRQGMPWLQIPYYNQDGQLVGIQNRNLVRGALPRFRFPSGSECGIYNLPVLRRLMPGDELWIAEGCSDCWSLLSAGHKAIAIPSATLLSKKDKELLAQFRCQGTGTWHLDCVGDATYQSPDISFHMAPDRDAPGERLFMQLKEILPSLEHHQLPKECKDYSDYYVSLKTQPS